MVLERRFMAIESRPSVSVVTIVLNDRKGFMRTAESVCNLQNADLEWIVIDGGSQDGTLEEISSFRKHISYTVSEKDNGIYDAMNKGLRVATRDYVVFMNAGDEFASPDALELVANSITANGGVAEVDMVLCGAILVFPNATQFYKPPRPPQYVAHSLPANHQSTFVRTTYHQRYEFPTEYRICGDFAAVATMIRDGARVVTLDQPTALRDTTLQSTAVKSTDVIYQECRKIQSEILGLPSAEIEESHRRRRRNQEGRRHLTRLASSNWTGSAMKAAFWLRNRIRPDHPSGASLLFSGNALQGHVRQDPDA